MNLFTPENIPGPALPPPCKHFMQPVVMPDGVTYFASSHHVRDPEDEVPDYGFYLDQVWKPDTIAIYTEWKDFGAPKLEGKQFLRLLHFVRALAKDATVEVGCIGGHGRTGTALACLAVLSGLTHEDAIAHIRTVYCEKAIETDIQEWVVQSVFCTVYGLEVPPQPDPPKFHVKSGDSWGYSDARSQKGDNEGKKAKVRTDAAGQDYCSLCLVDVISEDSQCVWCSATLEREKK